MKKIDTKNLDGMYDSENYPELTNGEAFHISLYHSKYRYGMPINKLNKLYTVYNETDNIKIRSAIKFICDWNGFAWEHFFSSCTTA